MQDREFLVAKNRHCFVRNVSYRISRGIYWDPFGRFRIAFGTRAAIG